MHPTKSFLGKCVTVLIGMGLSWVTMTNPQAEQVAQQIFGSRDQRNVGVELEPEALVATTVPNIVGEPKLAVAIAAPAEHTPMAQPQEGDQQRLEELSRMLKELGATYLRVEKLAKSGDTWFRVRCDLANNSDQIKCCLESTRGTAIDAMEDILQAARHGIQQPHGEPAAG